MNKKLLIAILVILALIGLVFAYKAMTKEEASEKLDGTICTMDYTPVCGVDGITYGNACMAGNMAIAYEGECGNQVSNEMPAPGSNTPEMVVDPAGGTYPAGEVPENLSDEELAAS